VDFSSSATAALTYAMLLAKEARAELTVLHVIEIPAALYETPGFDVDAYRMTAEAAARTRLCGLIPERVRTSCKVDMIVAEGKAAEEILRVATREDTDLIAMGMQGRRSVDLLWFGSNTHHVIRAASCPVLTVRER
jgi:nucleotide-binding universal stress UspA family protein